MTWRERLFTQRGFLIVGGVVLLIIGALGFFILKDSANSFFWLDSSENIAYIALGLVALAAVYVPGLNDALAPHYRWLVIVYGVIALFFGAYGFLLPQGSPASPNALGLANLELGDTVLNLVISAWAFLSAFRVPQQGTTRG